MKYPTDPDGFYQRLLEEIDRVGEEVTTRNSVVRRVTCASACFSFAPLLVARKVAWKNCLREMEWFLSGSSDIADLHEAVRPWWQPWADDRGHVLYNYGKQFCSMTTGGKLGFHQMGQLIHGLQKHPRSRRNCLTTWYGPEMNAPDCPITNCHGSWVQCVSDGSYLDLVMVQRSVDVICGLPHNLLQYWALLLHLAARSGLRPRKFHWTGVDVHLYQSHRELASKLIGLLRTKDFYRLTSERPALVYRPTADSFLAEDFFLDGQYRFLCEDRAEMVV